MKLPTLEKTLHGGNLWAVARARGIPPESIRDFSADLNPWAVDWVPQAVLEEAWRQVPHYPDPDYHRFREAAADWENVEPENILPANGTADLIHLISRWRKRARALIPVPTFTEYARAVAADGGEVVQWFLSPEEDFNGADLPEFFRVQEPDLLFLCNPNNPTGRLWSPAVIRECLASCARKGTLLVLDEAYMDLVSDSRRISFAREAACREDLLVLRSMTKAFGVPGLRLGYAVGHAALLARLRELQPPWSANTFAAEIGTWLLRSPAREMADSRRKLERDRLEMEAGLNRLRGVRAFPSDANFFLCQSQAGVSSLAQALEGKGILIRRCDDFEGLEPDRYLRVAVRRPDENRRLLEELREALRAC